jgi:hypothetical protein
MAAPINSDVTDLVTEKVHPAAVDGMIRRVVLHHYRTVFDHDEPHQLLVLQPLTQRVGDLIGGEGYGGEISRRCR